MATRFNLPPSGAAPVSPAFDAGWEQTGQASRLLLPRSNSLTALLLQNGFVRTVPITTTQDILCFQWVSVPLRAQLIQGTVSLIVLGLQSATTENVTVAIVVKVVSNDGGTLRGTLFSSFGSGSAFATGSAATVGTIASALTPLTVQTGDRLVVEIGGHAAAPSTAGSYTMSFRQDSSDFPATFGITTVGNPWVELSQNLFVEDFNEYKILAVPTGLSITG